jgi:hypothetical protein
MSQLKKAIEKLQRGDPTPMGFSVVSRQKPRALLLGVLVRDAEAGKAAIEAGVDLVILHTNDGGSAVDAVRGMGETSTPKGAWLSELSIAEAGALKEAGCDFVASPLEGTLAEAVDNDSMGQVLAVTNDMEEATLRALGPLGLDALFLKRPAGRMTLALQVDLARLAMLSGAPLLVNSPADISTGELRVLRDSGAAGLIASENTTTDELRALGERLREVPAKAKGRSGRDIAMVPSPSQTVHSHDDEDDDDDDE